jgi:hypothetical protein
MNLSSSEKFGINTKLNTIQAIRVICAILESDFTFYLPVEYREIFIHLLKYFPINVHFGISNLPILDSIYIDHKSPLTSINNLKRPLIFPNNMFDYCRFNWNQNRNIDFFISGLLTKSRLDIISKWLSKHSDQSSKKVNFDLSLIKLKNLLVLKYSNLRRKGFFIEHRITFNNSMRLCFTPSTIGRYFPKKAWDDKYFRELTKSKFVLCPNGDYIWTYRFFESMICGAIPIIEQYTNIYYGFHFFRLLDSIDIYNYDQEVVNENFEHVKQLLSIPKQELNQGILNAIKLTR